jgi:hypothetical protein
MNRSAVLSAWIDGVGVIAPGMTNWAQAADILTGKCGYLAVPSVLPAPLCLPAAERRRASRVVKLTLGIGLEAASLAQQDVGTLTTVFSASGADGHNCHALCEQLATDDRQISPTRFHNSVHNAAAGYWGIATRSMAPCQVLCAYDASFGAGLLDALGQVQVLGQPVMLLAYDSEYPEPLFAKRDTPDCAGVALVLAAQQGTRSLARVQVTACRDPADKMSDLELEDLRQAVPAMRSLPLLAAIARREPATTVVDYLAPMQLRTEVVPC